MTIQKTTPETTPTTRNGENQTPRVPTDTTRNGNNPQHTEIEEDEDTDDPTAETRTPGKNTPFNPETDPEADPQRIDPNTTEENPGKQRERERNPEEDNKPKR